MILHGYADVWAITGELCDNYQNLVLARTHFVHLKVRNKAKIRNQYNQVPQLIQGTIWESDKHKKTSHTGEPRGLTYPSRWPTGCKEQTRQYDRQKRSTNIRKDPQKKHRLFQQPNKPKYTFVNWGQQHSVICRPCLWIQGVSSYLSCMALTPCYKLQIALPQRHLVTHPFCEPSWVVPML